MKCFSATTRVAVAIFALMSFASVTKAGQQVPFKGNLQGDVVHTAVSPTVDAVVISAAGNVAHLGQCTITSEHLVDRPTRTAAGTYEITAANGDTITADFVGHATPTATAGVLSIVETATITGGPGRFAGATGNFTVERLYDAIAGTTEGSFEGSISSPGSSRQ
jgi:hypothetical protein